MISFQFSSIFLCSEMMFGPLYCFDGEVSRKHGAEHVAEELVQRPLPELVVGASVVRPGFGPLAPGVTAHPPPPVLI